MVVAKVYYDDRVYNKVFSHYPGEGYFTNVLVEGEYAFIVIDSMLVKWFPGVVDFITLQSDDAFFTKTFVKHQRGDVAIRSRSVFEPNMDRFTRITRFDFKKEKIYFDFRIMGRDSFVTESGKYTEVRCLLAFEEGQLVIEKMKIRGH